MARARAWCVIAHIGMRYQDVGTEERVVARNVPLHGSIHLNISFIGVNVRSACIYLFSTTAYVNGPLKKMH